jgi:hypothetical protein
LTNQPGGREAVLEAAAVHHVPERPRRPRFVIADARIDQDIMTRRPYDEALHAQHQPAADRIDECRLEPGTVLLEKLFGEGGEEFHHVEERPLLLDHRVNRYVLQCDCRRHRGDAFLKPDQDTADGSDLAALRIARAASPAGIVVPDASATRPPPFGRCRCFSMNRNLIAAADIR